jgi:hypothetical protein
MAFTMRALWTLFAALAFAGFRALSGREIMARVKVPKWRLPGIVADMRRRNIHSFLLVTSNYHTARAGKVFRRAAPDLEFHTVASLDPYFTPDGWWHNREGQKTALYESMKTVAAWVGL